MQPKSFNVELITCSWFSRHILGLISKSSFCCYEIRSLDTKQSKTGHTSRRHEWELIPYQTRCYFKAAKSPVFHPGPVRRLLWREADFMIWSRPSSLSLPRKSCSLSFSSIVWTHSVVLINPERGESSLGLAYSMLRVFIKIYREWLSSGYSK